MTGRSPTHVSAIRFRATTLAVLLVALACVASVFSASAAAKRKSTPVVPPTSQLRGVQLSPNRAFYPPPFGESAADDTREVASACQLGSRVVREFVSWPLLEPNGPGQIDGAYASKLDSLLAQAARCNIKVIFTLGGTPGWDSSAPTEKRAAAYPGNDGPSQYHRFVSWALDRWPSLYAVEVWNEPNLPQYWQGSPGQYADLVNAAVAAKRETGSSTLILAGTLALAATDYLSQLYAAGMRGEDGISLHPYSVTCPDLCQAAKWIDPASPRNPFRGAIESIHRVMADNGDAAGLWLTEFGFSTCPSQPACVPEDVQASWMAKSVRMAACFPYIQGLTTFTLRDISVPSTWDSTNWNFHYGLMHTDFSPKPALSAVQGAFSQLARADAAAARTARKASARGAKSSRARAAGLASSRMCRRLLGTPRGHKARAGHH
jgi:hypothetical protein